MSCVREACNQLNTAQCMCLHIRLLLDASQIVFRFFSFLGEYSFRCSVNSSRLVFNERVANHLYRIVSHTFVCTCVVVLKCVRLTVCICGKFLSELRTTVDAVCIRWLSAWTVDLLNDLLVMMFHHLFRLFVTRSVAYNNGALEEDFVSQAANKVHDLICTMNFRSVFLQWQF